MFDYFAKPLHNPARRHQERRGARATEVLHDALDRLEGLPAPAEVRPLRARRRALDRLRARRPARARDLSAIVVFALVLALWLLA